MLNFYIVFLQFPPVAEDNPRDFVKAVGDGWSLDDGGSEARKLRDSMSWAGRQHASRLIRLVRSKQDRLIHIQSVFLFAKFPRKVRYPKGQCSERECERETLFKPVFRSVSLLK